MHYKALLQQVDALTAGVPHITANLANTAAAIWQHFENINWAGFYLREKEQLILGPFMGKPACIEIPMGRGVCGTAAGLDATQLVADVHAFPGHIACDSDSNSEIVIPIHKNGAVWGVLDIDSPILNRFSQADRQALEELAKILEKNLFTY